MAKYGTFKYGDGTKYGILAIFGMKPTVSRGVQSVPTARGVQSVPTARGVHYG